MASLDAKATYCLNEAERGSRRAATLAACTQPRHKRPLCHAARLAAPRVRAPSRIRAALAEKS